MTSKAKWDTTGLERVLKRLRKLEEREIQVGFFPESRYDKSNNRLQVAQVAKWQEEGTYKKSGQQHIPPRPFFSSYVLRIHSIGDPVETRFSYYLRAVASAAFNGGRSITVPAELQGLGNAMKEGLQQEILDWSTPGNAAYTVEQKGFDDPLIETGKMYDSVKFKIKKTGESNGD